MSEPRTLRIGMLGCGTVGSGILTILAREGDDVAARVGARLEVTRIAVRDVHRERLVPVDPAVFTDDAMGVATDDDVDIVVEVMGGREAAGELIRAALAAGKPVVTANKELVAHEGAELIDAAAEAGIDFLYEAAVAGAIPIIKPLKESLAGDRVRRVMGILNGTTNYILTRMAEEDASYDDVLAQAQELGYAEADPTADVGGFDAAAKTAILASLAFDTRVRADDVHTEGIENVTATDMATAARLGYVIKLLGIASETADGVAARVHPTFVPKAHPLASVRMAFNAVFVEAEAAGELMFYGRGAGGEPTGSAVLGDVIDVARNLLQAARGAVESTHREIPLRPFETLSTQYYLLLEVADEPGVLADVSRIFADNDVSIAQVWQDEDAQGAGAELVLVTHRARESALAATRAALEQASAVRRVVSVLRVESERPA